ncbi:MAG: mobilization protein [Mucilaginibacter sp.]|nr:mobilization protein [Mucilaginibacter sp.]
MAIIKILSRHTPSYGSLIRYILDETKTDPSQAITHNLRSNTIDDYIKEFAENEAFRKMSRSDQIYITHEILAFSSDEKAETLTSESLTDIANEYIRLRGFEGVLLGAIHHDKEHIHVHFCVSALKYRTGTSYGLSKAKLSELKVSLQRYHRDKYPGITESFPEHGKGKAYVTDRAWQAKHREERTKRKEMIMEMVRNCFERSQSQTHFLELLRSNDLHHYERDGKAAGIEFEGTKFRFSRLLETSQFESLPVDFSEEEKVLADIQSIRKQRGEMEQERDWGELAR